MRIALAMLTRPALMIAAVATAAAVGVSRLAPAPNGARTPRAAGHVLISRPGLDPCHPGTLWLDADSGRTTVLPTPGGAVLQRASLAPWLDESGGAQVAGLLTCRPGDSRADCVELVRATFPGGRVIDRTAIDVFPVCHPCWYPGTRARILFATGEGRLYQHAFEGPEGRSDVAEPRSGGRPLALEWHLGGSLAEDFRVSDPCWPSDPRFGRTILAGVRTLEDAGAVARWSRSRLWWLRLSEDGDAIEATGPLIDADSLADDLEHHSPSVGRTADGGLVVAYFTGVDGPSWDLRLARLTLDDAGHPSVAAGSAPTLAERCRADIPPAFSGDGRWISVVRSDPLGRGSVLRIDLAARRPTPPPPAPPSPPGKWSLVVSAVQALIRLGDPHNVPPATVARQGL